MHVPTTNRLLSALTPESRERVMRLCTPVTLPLKTPLYDTEETPVHAFFMTSGMASVVTSMEDGGVAEVGVIGLEGLVGAYHLLGPSKNSTDCFMQLEGTALRITLRDLRDAFRSSEDIRDRILEFVQSSSLTTSQVAGCNRLHEAEERLARWLLMAQDRSQSDDMYFTQEFLAMMVGARRTTVTLIAGALQRADLIEYSRGRVKSSVVKNSKRPRAIVIGLVRISSATSTATPRKRSDATVSLYGGSNHRPLL